jgi:hypothetical protein
VAAVAPILKLLSKGVDDLDLAFSLINLVRVCAWSARVCVVFALRPARWPTEHTARLSWAPGPHTHAMLHTQRHAYTHVHTHTHAHTHTHTHKLTHTGQPTGGEPGGPQRAGVPGLDQGPGAHHPLLPGPCVCVCAYECVRFCVAMPLPLDLPASAM